ncbi:hypothetical protein RHGRI_024014 [Rhododendron griersonianum]|uniref:HAT C-terminal dimerisation domain-containing protein n=1 Tax=Rhododendron griersonianum TaxID=479676 RepID=A0AAV6J5W0_9ERIC|nr:hypothetical protein RHGRI_024014 [Rhododendron griersonianum]
MNCLGFLPEGLSKILPSPPVSDSLPESQLSPPFSDSDSLTPVSRLRHRQALVCFGEDWDWEIIFSLRSTLVWKADTIQPVKSDLDIYLEEGVYICASQAQGEEVLDPHFDALEWWKANTLKYRILSKMACDILSIPITSESTFSAGGRVIDPYRASLATETVEMLLCGADYVRAYHGLKKGSDYWLDTDDRWLDQILTAETFLSYSLDRNLKTGPEARWAFLFKRPVKTSLVELKNRKWTKKGDSGGGPSFGGSVLIKNGSELLCDNQLAVAGALRRPVKEGRTDGGHRSQTIVDDSEVCIIPDRSSLSSTSAFSFLEEGEFGAITGGCSSLSNSDLSETVRDEASLARVVDENCIGVRDSSVSDSGGLRLAVEEVEVVGTGRVIRGGCIEIGEGGVNSKGLELVPYAGLEGEFSMWGSQIEEGLFQQLGRVQDLVDVGLERNDSELISAVGRESEEPWNDRELLTIGMSQAEVSKWVLKRINGFRKFLGVSFDGFEDRTMQLFADIEEKWRNEVDRK